MIYKFAFLYAVTGEHCSPLQFCYNYFLAALPFFFESITFVRMPRISAAATSVSVIVNPVRRAQMFAKPYEQMTYPEEQLQTEADTEKRDMGCGGLSDDIDEPVLVKAVHRVAKGADTRENDMVCG